MNSVTAMIPPLYPEIYSNADPSITSAVSWIAKCWMQGHLRWRKTSHPTSGSVLLWRTQGEWKVPGRSPIPPKAKLKKKNTNFVDTIIPNVLCVLRLISNQPLKSAG